ncbi:MAG: anti-sigma factor [Pseudomonadota bacterium]
MTAHDPHPDEIDLLAAEHVLGLLDPPEEERAVDRMRTDSDFAARVERWRERLAELDFTAAEGVADPALLARIVATLDGTADAPEASPILSDRAAHAAEGTRVTGASGVTGATGAPRTGRGAPAKGPRLWDHLALWRATGLAGMAATLLLALGIAFGPFSGPPQPRLVAVLMGPQGEPAAVVNAYADGTADLIPLRSIAVPDGRVLEVWTLWDPARGPVSIGLSNEARRIRLDLKNLPRTAPDQLFEITLEPRGGSPIGRPTGPILMKGTTSLAL